MYKKEKEEDITERIARRYSKLIRAATEEFDWGLMGGNWLGEGEVTEKQIKELLRYLKGGMPTGEKHKLERLPHYVWKRVYDDDGNIDYDLSETEKTDEQLLEELLRNAERERE